MANENEDGSMGELKQKIEQLQVENQKIQNEFNLQRAKLRELFIQKETEYTKCVKDKDILQCELDELKSQFLVANLKCENEQRFKDMKAHEEISSLQQIVQDTVAEMERIGRENNRLLVENRMLRESNTQQQQSQESTSITPQVLSHVKKTLGKLGVGDITSLSSISHDSIDDSLDKENSRDLVHEDAEVLSSIVLQLQDEMKVIKEKLREADEKLQACNEDALKKAAIAGTQDDRESDGENDSCAKCQNFKTQLEKMQSECAEDKRKLKGMDDSIAELNESLQKEAVLRKGLEDQWQEKRELHKNEVQLLREQVAKAENDLLNLQQNFVEAKEETLKQIHRVVEGRETINKHLQMVQADNDFLSGCYLATAEEIENQYINLPNTVDELQELMLKQQNDLIQARVSAEYEKRKCVTSLTEIEILNEQLKASSADRSNIQKRLQEEIKTIQEQLGKLTQRLEECEIAKTALERKESELNKRVSELRVENIELQEANENLKRKNMDYKGKVKNLQDDLATSEQVQKDFVTLSQRLQMSLESLRGADKEVRWQDDDDIDICPLCKIQFTVTVRKIHCRHCGNIYCDKCLTKTVPSGPRKRKARVCDICHTLLSPNTAPYFSHEPI